MEGNKETNVNRRKIRERKKESKKRRKQKEDATFQKVLKGGPRDKTPQYWWLGCG